MIDEDQCYLTMASWIDRVYRSEIVTNCTDQKVTNFYDSSGDMVPGSYFNLEVYVLKVITN